MSKSDWIDGEQLQYDIETGNYVVTTSGGTVAIKQNPWNTVWTTSGVSPLTSEEQKELEELKKQHEVAIKQAQINHFKKCDRAHRQFIVNIILTRNLGAEVTGTTVEKSERHRDLELRNELTTFNMRKLSGMSWDYESKRGIQITIQNLGFPDSIKDEDLIQAHVEACMEEDMLGKE